MTVVSIFTCYTTGSGELMDSAADLVASDFALHHFAFGALLLSDEYSTCA